jgi:RNA polymerase sigma-70 factor, ECF subfamily
MGLPELNQGTSTDIAALVVKAKRGDEVAFGELVALTKNSLYRFLLFLSGDGPLADDLSQDTYLYAIEHIRKLKNERAFLKWLFQIGKNKLFDHRKSPRNKSHEMVDHRLADHSVVQKEMHFQIMEAFRHLELHDREVLVLIDLEGYTYLEASEIIEISEQAVVSRLHRARKALKAVLAP